MTREARTRIKDKLACECGGHLVAVVDSRPQQYMGIRSIWRRRLCDTCGKRSTTIEATKIDFERIGAATAAERQRRIQELRAELDRLEASA